MRARKVAEIVDASRFGQYRLMKEVMGLMLETLKNSRLKLCSLFYTNLQGDGSSGSEIQLLRGEVEFYHVSGENFEETHSDMLKQYFGLLDKLRASFERYIQGGKCGVLSIMVDPEDGVKVAFTPTLEPEDLIVFNHEYVSHWV